LKSKLVSDCIDNQEYLLAKLKFVNLYFPDAKYHHDYYPYYKRIATGLPSLNLSFSSKLVNTNYNSLDFVTKYSTLYVAPIHKLTFSYTQKGEVKTEEIIVHSAPKLNRLAYTAWQGGPKGKEIRFSRFTFNMKGHEFDEEIFNSCRGAIMKFIQQNPGLPINEKHLEPKLKKLLVFI